EAIFTENNRLIIAYGAYGGQGLYILRSNPDGGFDGVNGRRDGALFQNFIVGERISMAIAPDGTLGIAFYVIEDDDGVAEDLWFCESEDNGETINVGANCTIVEEPFLSVGAFPSLAYDSESRPAISYQFCGADATCSRDGLRYAWRDDTGLWWKFNVHNVDNNRSGLYTSLVIDPATDAPTIAFHDLTRGAAMLAVGAFDGGGSGPCAVE
ncbi:MAG: hypothetical protein AAF658_16675, partial [Myxococcota bacterium]